MATTSRSPIGTASKGGGSKRAPGEKMPLRKNTMEQRVAAKLNPSIAVPPAGQKMYEVATFRAARKARKLGTARGDHA